MWEWICFVVARHRLRNVDPELCMCGSMLNHHSYSDNHGFVSAKDYCLREDAYWISVGGKLL